MCQMTGLFSFGGLEPSEWKPRSKEGCGSVGEIYSFFSRK